MEQTNRAERIPIERLIEIMYEFYADGVTHVDITIKDIRTVVITENKHINEDPLNQLPLK